MQHRFYYPIWYPEEDGCNRFLSNVLAFVSLALFLFLAVGASVYYGCVVQYSVAHGVTTPLVTLCWLSSDANTTTAVGFVAGAGLCKQFTAIPMIRKPGSMAVKAFAILDDDMGARVRAAGSRPFFDRDHWSGLICLVIPGVWLTACMWHEAPLWYNIFTSIGPAAALHIIPHTAYFIATTEFFWRSCEALEAALDGFRVVTLNPQAPFLNQINLKQYKIPFLNQINVKQSNIY